jgi:acyl-CoA reductase-like NAD-dependent aldehyde dehydrogenase
MKVGSLSEQIDKLVREHLAQVQVDASAALERAFGASTSPRKATASPRKRASGKRRSSQEVEKLAERLHACVMAEPGEPMTHYAGQLGASVRELHLPMTQLRGDSRLRTTGSRNDMRYYPRPGS